MTPDTPNGETNIKRLSVLQAVAQGYCPISQDETEQEICTGNQDASADARYYKSRDSSSNST